MLGTFMLFSFENFIPFLYFHNLSFQDSHLKFSFNKLANKKSDTVTVSDCLSGKK